MPKRGRPPIGAAAKTAAQRAWEYRQRTKRHRTDEAIESNRLVRKLQVDVREAEQRQAGPLVDKLNEAERRMRLAEQEAAKFRAENQKLQATIQQLKRRIDKQKTENVADVIARFAPKSTRLPRNIEGLMIKALGMLGSDSSGERDNAASLVERLRRESGLTWSDIFGKPF